MFLVFTLPLMPAQFVLIRMGSSYARTFPQWYHRQVCRLLGVRVVVEGTLPEAGGALLVSNHVSWLDIPVLSAVAPVSFIAKREVGTWPFVKWLATLQRSIFIDRERRRDASAAGNAIVERLAAGDNLVLFAEGTSGPGNKVLPFHTALFGAVRGTGPIREDIAVQTVTLAYTRIQGLPIDRDDRPMIGWYGDMDMAPHGWKLLKLGPIDAVVRIGPPLPLADFPDRKALAKWCEARVRADLAALLHGSARHGDGTTAPPHGRGEPEQVEVPPA